MKLSDYVIHFIAAQGIRTVFGLTGGAVVHLFDSADRHPTLQPVFCHHEQAAALAAVSYARIRNALGAAIVTTGPGGTNSLTGVAAAWQDSIPCLFISGQSRKEHTTHGTSLRQLGSQELDIVTVVRSMTKYAAMVESPDRIRYHLEKAVHLATTGRPGPAWIDLPLNFQWADIEPESLPGFDAGDTGSCPTMSEKIREECSRVEKLLHEAQRPVVLVGYGIRLANAEQALRRFIDRFGCPFVATWTASDILPTDHPLSVGRPGIAGQRGANLAVQNCDLLLCLGSHLSIPLTGTLFHAFARDATIVMVDIDPQELAYQTVRVDVPILCDVRRFLDMMLEDARQDDSKKIEPWRLMCRNYARYNRIPESWKKEGLYVNNYVLVDALSEMLTDEDVVVDGGGTNVYITFQAMRVKKGQRLTLSSGICAMGTGLPESIGACFANGGKTIVCLIGDGSLQLNLQELQTIRHHNLPIKVFVLNNGGYLAIRHTQAGFLKGNYVGSTPAGGMSLPDSKRIAAAFGFGTATIRKHSEMQDILRSVLDSDGPVLCEVMIDPQQQVVPSQGFSQNPDGTYSPRPLEDMFPYLDRGEFLRNMITKPLPESMKE